ncbi:Zn-dependent peptidase ImmA (M78 family) [Martelella mediterranea]|uniref:Zn-dependent peptidase ImmA (M78 family) n=1 Tax=Martelella mediterranea TaxID=293089 RepID=A0A4R3NQD8_9HYPH|nr:Zn-dependent peptidase ImmA (M78 family) [Martelella mediterranea]
MARQRRALTKKSLASALSVAPRAVTGWEADEYPPDPEKVAAISRVLGFPTSFFELDDTSKTPEGAVSFRSLTKKTAGQRDAALSMCDIAKDVTDWINDRFDVPKPVLPDMRDEAPYIAASLLRQEWGLGNKPIKNLLHLLEAKGVRVFSLAENCREIDACSFWSNNVPFVLLNTDMSSERMRFDMAHELGHLVLHKHAAPMGRLAENEANAFASELLMPEQSVRANRASNWSIPVLVQRKKIWNVSVSALAYRVHQLGLMSEWHFKSLNIEMRRRGYKTSEPESSPREQSKVLEIVLQRLRELGMPLKFAANQMALPESELRGLFYGIAKVAVEGMADLEQQRGSSAHLRIIK